MGIRFWRSILRSWGRESDTVVEEFDSKLKGNGAELPDYFMKTLLTIVHVILHPGSLSERKEKEKEGGGAKGKCKARRIEDSRERLSRLRGNWRWRSERGINGRKDMTRNTEITEIGIGTGGRTCTIGTRGIERGIMMMVMMSGEEEDTGIEIGGGTGIGKTGVKRTLGTRGRMRGIEGIVRVVVYK